jgi:hypothetical protein
MAGESLDRRECIGIQSPNRAKRDGGEGSFDKRLFVGRSPGSPIPVHFSRPAFLSPAG